MTHSGHGSEPGREERAGAVPPASDGAVPPAGGEPWWAQEPSPAAAEPAVDESTQQIRHLGNRPQRPQAPEHSPAPQAPQPPQGAPQQWERPAGPPPGPADDGAATQLIPPVSGAAPEQRPGDDDATQLIPPLSGPYEAAPPGAHEPPPGSGPAPGPPPGPAPFAPPPEDPPRTARHAAPAHTQFEGLFRDSAPAAPPAGPAGPAGPPGDPGATQKLPPVSAAGPGAPARGGPPGAPPPGPYPAQGHGAPGPARRPGYGYPGPEGPGGPPPGPYGSGDGGPGPGRYYYDDEDDDRRGSIPRWAAIAIGTAACAAVGITAGWLLSSGDDGGDTASGATPSASAEQEPGGKDDGTGGDDEKPAEDPAEKQAEDLDALLAESNDSRDAVIRSVENIRQCKALGKAAKDLRAAAGQRRDLVTRLADLTVDELPSHRDLTRSLTDAWKASASADDHYAAWADAAKRGKRCNGGGNHLAAGNRASGDATRAKEEAAGLWNPIADEYGLTRRQATQL